MKFKLKKALASFVAVCMLLCISPIMALAEDASFDIITVGPEDCDFIDLQAAINSVGTEETTIVLMADIITNSTIRIETRHTIRLTSGGGGLYKIDGDGGNFPVVTNRGKLFLSDIIITGADTASDGGGVWNTGSYGKLIIQDGCVISGNYTTARGGGVYSNGVPGVVMEGGEISGNQAGNGGGICIYTERTFSMYGGLITGNDAKYGGGVYNSSKVNFTMEGGEISGNTSTANGGGIYNDSSVNFSMRRGAIKGNTALGDGGGVMNSNNTVFTMEGGEISGNNANESGKKHYYNGGGGVNLANHVTFTMSGGEISGNTSGYFGGGVAVALYATFTMSGGEISGNNAFSGGGVINTSGSLIVNGGKISDNTAGDSGGGVFNHNHADFVMNDGRITGNTAVRGGGVNNDSSSSFEMAGGAVTGNIAEFSGGGIYNAALPQLIVKVGAVFAGNKAPTAYERKPADDGVYETNILLGEGEGKWTAPFTQGYNNYDISYVNVAPINISNLPPAQQIDNGAGTDTDTDTGTGNDNVIDIDIDTEPDTDPGITQVKPFPPGDGDHLVPDGDRYIKVDDDGTPLGEWHWDDDLKLWIFDEYAPLGDIPRTGDMKIPGIYYIVFIIALLSFLTVVKTGMPRKPK